MNRIPHPLDRLLHAAAQATPQPVAPLSYRTEETVITQWKTPAPPEELLWETDLYTPALASGFALALVSLLVGTLTPLLSNASDLEWSLIAVQRLCTL